MIKMLINKLLLLSLFVLMISCSFEQKLSKEWKMDSVGKTWSKSGIGTIPISLRKYDQEQKSNLKKGINFSGWYQTDLIHLVSDAYKFRYIDKDNSTGKAMVYWGWFCNFNNLSDNDKTFSILYNLYDIDGFLISSSEYPNVRVNSGEKMKKFQTTGTFSYDQLDNVYRREVILKDLQEPYKIEYQFKSLKKTKD
jgi:hypothetical protein